MKRTVSLLLLLGLLLANVASCSDGENTKDPSLSDPSSSGSDDTTGGESTEDDTISDNLPEVTFDGKPYTLLTDSEYLEYNEFAHEETTGESIDDAVYRQVTTVEDRFDVKFDTYASGDPGKDLQTSSTAGDNAYQAAMYSNMGIASLAYNDLLLNLNELEYLDFSKPWWSQKINDVLTVNGKTYNAFGDFFAQRAIYFIHMIYFNKDLLLDYTTESPYQIVFDGKWTFDKLNELIAGSQKNLNGDDVMDLEDQWGFIQSEIQSAVFLYTSGGHILVRDAEGLPTLDYNNEFNVDLFSFIFDFDFRNDAVMTTTQANEGLAAQIFTSGRALFYSGFFYDCPTIRQMEDNLGILPFPKYEESADYITWLTGGNALLGIPSATASADYDFVGIVTEAMAAEGYRYVRPAVYDNTLQGKLARDPESAKMIDLIYNTITTDLGWIYNGENGVGWFMNDLLVNRVENFSSIYQRTARRAENEYDKLRAMYAEEDE